MIKVNVLNAMILQLVLKMANVNVLEIKPLVKQVCVRIVDLVVINVMKIHAYNV